MRPLWTTLPFAAAIVASTFFIACGGDDDNDGIEDTPVPPSDEQRLGHLQTGFEEIEFTGTYTLEVTSPDGTVAGTATYVSLPPESLAVDFTGNFGGIDGRLVTIRTAEATYICQEAQGEDAPPPFCLEGNAGLVGLGDIATLNLGNVVSGLGVGSDVTVEAADGREIAGKDAECFTFSGGETEGTMCFDEETGVMLLVDATNSGTTTRIEATDIDDDADEEAFVPPFDILEMG